MGQQNMMIWNSYYSHISNMWQEILENTWKKSLLPTVFMTKSTSVPALFLFLNFKIKNNEFKGIAYYSKAFFSDGTKEYLRVQVTSIASGLF